MEFFNKMFLMCTIILILVFIWTRFFISRNLIAHALGQVDNTPYTNSLEAFNDSYKRGYRFYEVDLTLTKDNKVVCFHGYQKDIYQQFNIKKKEFSYKNFINGAIFEKSPVKFTTLGLGDLIDLVRQNKNIKVLLHIQSKKNALKTARVLDEIVKEVGNDLEIFDRFIVGVNFVGEFDEIKKRKQFKNYGYYVRVKEKRPEKYSNIHDIISYMKQNKITFSSIAYDVFKENPEQALGELKELKKNNITVLVFTVNNVPEILRLKYNDVDFIGTDAILNFFE